MFGFGSKSANPVNKKEDDLESKELLNKP